MRPSRSRLAQADSHLLVVEDIDGQSFFLILTKPTKAGIPLYFGKRDMAAGRSTIVLTKALADHLRAYHAAGGIWSVGEIGIDLSPAAIKLLFRRLGLNVFDGREQWWRQREGDLFSLTTADFSKRHGVTGTSINVWRRRLKNG